MKRSTTASLVLMGLAPLLLTACDEPGLSLSTQQQSFSSVDQCVHAGVPAATCESASESKPTFATQDLCVAKFGAGKCAQSGLDPSSPWMPTLPGFVISRTLKGDGSYTYVSAGPLSAPGSPAVGTGWVAPAVVDDTYGASDDDVADADGSGAQQQSFTSVDQCVAAGVPKDTCQRAYDNKPQFASQDQCVARFGAGQCQQSDSGDHSVWMPMLTGFMIGRMLDNSGGYTYVSSGPVYRSSGGGGVYGGSYTSSGSGWSSVSGSSFGSSAGARAITSSRGGFGSSSAMSGGWGG